MNSKISIIEKYKDLINVEISKKWLPNPEDGYIPQMPDFVSIAKTTQENGFIENYCLGETEVKQLKLQRILLKRKNN